MLNVAGVPQAPDLALAWAANQDDDTVLRHARRQLQADVAELGIAAELRVLRGDAARRICEHAEAAGQALVIAGMARDEAFGRFLVGSTVAQLVRRLTRPLLVVRARARRPYARVLVATDFSESSRHALDTALQYFPAAQFTLYHARSATGSQPEDAATAERLNQAVLQGECADFLAASALPDAVRARLTVVVERGPLDSALTRHVREHDIELVAMGAQGRSGLLGMLVGSSAARLLDWLPCDTLIVRMPPSAAS